LTIFAKKKEKTLEPSIPLRKEGRGEKDYTEGLRQVEPSHSLAACGVCQMWAQAHLIFKKGIEKRARVRKECRRKKENLGQRLTTFAKATKEILDSTMSKEGRRALTTRHNNRTWALTGNARGTCWNSLHSPSKKKKEVHVRSHHMSTMYVASGGFCNKKRKERKQGPRQRKKEKNKFHANKRRKKKNERE